MRAEAIAIFPGGFGTLDELFESLTLIQTGRMKKVPILLFGSEFWNNIVNWDALSEAGTISAEDLELFLRIQTSNEHSEIDLSQKFGANINESIHLAKLIKLKAKKFGLSFHVGSQCMHPVAYSKAIKDLGTIIKKSGVIPDTINVGGGFPWLSG